MTVKVPHGTGHVAPGVPEFVGDSHRGIAGAVKLGTKWWDLNWLGKWCAHYPYPLKHGFTDPTGKLRRDLALGFMTDVEVRRLEATYRGEVYGIRTMTERVLYALGLGLRVEAELKDRQPLEAFRQLHDAVSSHGFDPAHVEVKVGLWHPGRPWLWLRPAARYFTTTALTHGEKGQPNPERFAELPAEAEAWVDQYRGFPPRFVK